MDITEGLRNSEEHSLIVRIKLQLQTRNSLAIVQRNFRKNSDLWLSLSLKNVISWGNNFPEVQCPLAHKGGCSDLSPPAFPWSEITLLVAACRYLKITDVAVLMEVLIPQVHFSSSPVPSFQKDFTHLFLAKRLRNSLFEQCSGGEAEIKDSCNRN